MSVRVPTGPPPPDGYQPPPGEPPKPDGRSARGPVLIALAVLLGAAALVTSAIVLTRGDSADETVTPGGPASSTAAPSAATTIDPQAAVKADIIAGYRATWDAHLAVGRDRKATADDERLRATRTGDSLAAIQRSLRSFKDRNEVLTGEVKLHPVVVEIKGDTATIRDCLDDATGSANADTGRVAEPPTRIVTTITSTMKLVDGVWKQSNYRDEKVPCTPAAS